MPKLKPTDAEDTQGGSAAATTAPSPASEHAFTPPAVGVGMAAPYAPPASAETTAMREEIARLKAKLAAEEERVRTAEAAAVSSQPGYWRVELQHATTRIVYARSQGDAWGEYCRRMGVLGSQWSPVVTPATEEDFQAQEKALARP